MIDYARLMTQAARLRRMLGEDDNSPVDIFALAQSIDGLTIVYYPMGENLSGMCIKGQSDNKLIAINSAMTLGRQRYSLAHEFYHLFYDDNLVSVCAKKINAGREVERDADMFASYFLMPDVALHELAEKITKQRQEKEMSLNDVIRIEQYFRVSHQATVYRLMHTPYLSDETGNDYLCKSVRNRAETLGYSADLYRPSSEARRFMTYGKYITQAQLVLEKKLVSVGKYEELMLEAFRADLVYGMGEEEGDMID